MQDLIPYENPSIRSDVTVLGYDYDTQTPVTIGDREATSHMHVMGVTGVGKSTLLINSFLGGIKRGQGGAYITPDLGAIQSILDRIPPNRLGDVIYLNPGDERYPFGFNLLSCDNVLDQKERERSADRLMHVFKRLWGPRSEDAAWGARLENFLRNCTLSLMYHELTLAEIPSLLLDTEFRDKVVSTLPKTGPWYYVRLFWKNYDKLRFQTQEERSESTLVRILAFLTKSTIENIVGQQETTIDFRQIMQEQKILLVRLAEDDIQDDGIKLLGTMIVAELLKASLARERINEEEWHYFSLICDEFPEFASDDFHKLLTRARKYNVKITIASQYLDRTEDRIRLAVENTGNKITFKTTIEDAKYFAPVYAKEPPPGEMIYERRMRKVQQTKTTYTAYWDPPEAQEACKQAFAELHHVLIEQLLLAKAFGIGIENEFYQKRVGTHGCTYTLPLPISMPPAMPEKTVLSVGNFDNKYPKTSEYSDGWDVKSYDYPIEEIANWQSTVFVYSQQLKPHTKLWDYLIKCYKESNYGGNKIGVVFPANGHWRIEHEKVGNFPLRDNMYVQRERQAKQIHREFYYTFWSSEQKCRDTIVYVPVLDFLVRPDIRKGVAYTMPEGTFQIAIVDRLRDFALNIPYEKDCEFISRLSDQHYTVETAIKQAYADELDALLAPFRRRATFYFDFDAYQYLYNSLRNPSFAPDNMPVMKEHWIGPYYHDEEALWKILITWIQQKVLQVDARKKEAIQRAQELAACFHSEKDVRLLDEWYEPQRITEWEYKRVGGLLNGHDDYIETEREQFTARRGPSPYTTSEMKDQMEQELLRLPDHTAYCQIKNLQAEDDEKGMVQCKIKTYPLPPSYVVSKEEAQNRLAYVEAQTRALYCTPREDVERAIAWRREFWEPKVQDIPSRPSDPAAQPTVPPVIIVPEQPRREETKVSAVPQPVGVSYKVCPVCGAQNEINELKCEQCRTGLQQVEITTEVVTQQSNEAAQDQPKKKKSRRG